MSMAQPRLSEGFPEKVTLSRVLEEKQEEWKLFSEKVNGVVFGEVPAMA